MKRSSANSALINRKRGISSAKYYRCRTSRSFLKRPNPLCAALRAPGMQSVVSTSVKLHLDVSLMLRNTHATVRVTPLLRAVQRLARKARRVFREDLQVGLTKEAQLRGRPKNPESQTSQPRSRATARERNNTGVGLPSSAQPTALQLADRGPRLRSGCYIADVRVFTRSPWLPAPASSWESSDRAPWRSCR